MGELKKIESRISKTCKQCSKSFAVTPRHQSVRACDFCSSACAFQFKTAKHSIHDDLIKTLYLEEKKSIYEIGKEIGLSGTGVQYRLKQMGIPRRTMRELMFGDQNPTRGKGHTAKTIEKLRQSSNAYFSDTENRLKQAEMTAKQIAEGRTGKTGNTLEVTMMRLLEAAGIKFEHSKRVSYFVFDFYLPELDLFVECDGTFWHSDPRFYPDREKLTKIQRHNLTNDARKNSFAKTRGMRLVRFWEYDILHHGDTVMKQILDLKTDSSARTC